MTKAGLADWIAAANPLAAHATRDQALRAARWSALSLILTAAVSILQAAVMWINRDGAAAAMIDFMQAFAMAGAPAEAVEMQAAMMRAMIPGLILQSVVWSGLVAVIYLGVAKAQWDRPNKWIPIVFLVLGGLALVSALGNLLAIVAFEQAAMEMAALPGPPSYRMLGLPPWVLVLGGMESLLAVILQTAALRGALALKRLST